MKKALDQCPYCLSMNLGYGDTPVQGPEGEEWEVFCRDCYEEWLEIV